MPGMAEIEMTLGWVIAYVDDPAAAAAFYERTFGLRTDFVVPGEYAQMDTGPTKLGFATYALARGNFDGGVRPAGSDGPPPNVEIALVAEDVDAAYVTSCDVPLLVPLVSTGAFMRVLDAVAAGVDAAFNWMPVPRG